ncbi:MAG: Maf family protein [Candidatus Thorarchaeota archaeon]
MTKIILASASPRRHELLNLIGIDHIVKPCSEKETKLENNIVDTSDTEKNNRTIEEKIIQLATDKALCVAKTLSIDEKKNGIILGADTIVVLNNEIIGKPTDFNDAVGMLSKLAGKTHFVFTGICLYDFLKDRIHTGVERTRVTMADWNEIRIRAYIQSENVMDKAGAYAIQGIGAAMIEKIEGCFYNVMGLPVSRLVKMLDEMGFNYLKK